MRKTLDEGVMAERFTFHDLRAKAGSEAENPTELLGHDDPRTTNRIYRRRPRVVTPVRRKIFANR
jgi:integrase